MKLRLAAIYPFVALSMAFTACIEFNPIGAEDQPCGKNGGCWDELVCCSDDVCRKSCQGDGDMADGDIADGDTLDGDTSDGDTSADGDIGGDEDTCNSNGNYSCDSGDVYYFDSCGNKLSKKSECDDCACTGSVCVEDDQHSYKCYNDDVYYYSCHGERGDKKVECDQCGCSNGECAINEQYSSACYNGDVYWYDCHGERTKKSKECKTLGCTSSSCNTTPGFVPIEAGSFWMGSPQSSTCPDGYPGVCADELGNDSDEILHYVTLTYDFELSRYEITEAEFEGLMGWNPVDTHNAACQYGCGDTHPVKYVSWFDVLAYANELSLDAGLTPCYVFSGVTCEDSSSQGGTYMACMNATRKGIDSATVTLTGGATKPQDCEGYRLPTEAEWEYAIRAGDQYTAFYQSDGNDGTITNTETSPVDPNLTQIAWFGGNNTSEGTKPIGGKEPNAWGLNDMSGNAWEWVWDWYQEDYQNDLATDPTGPSTPSSFRVSRGGNWGGNARYCRSADRNGNSPGVRVNDVGARLSRSSP